MENKTNRIVIVTESGEVDYKSKLHEYTSRIETMRSNMYYLHDSIQSFLNHGNSYKKEEIIKYSALLNPQEVEKLLTKTYKAFNDILDQEEKLKAKKLQSDKKTPISDDIF